MMDELLNCMIDDICNHIKADLSAKTKDSKGNIAFVNKQGQPALNLMKKETKNNGLIFTTNIAENSR